MCSFGAIRTIINRHSRDTDIKLGENEKSFAWMLLATFKFFSLIGKKQSLQVSNSLQPTVELLKRSEVLILQFIQVEAFSREMKALKSGNMVSGRSLLFKCAPMLPDEGLIRIAGRTDKAEISYDA